MCGTEAQLFRCRIEGTILHVCKTCGKHGEIIEKMKENSKTEEELPMPKAERSEIIQIISSDYANLVKSKREAAGLKQKELAQKIAEKESLIHKIESGHKEPSLAVARKLEKFLGITLVLQHQEKSIGTTKSEDESMTIGDFVKIRKR